MCTLVAQRVDDFLLWMEEITSLVVVVHETCSKVRASPSSLFTLYLGLYLCFYHIQYGVAIIHPSPPINMRKWDIIK